VRCEQSEAIEENGRSQKGECDKGEHNGKWENVGENATLNINGRVGARLEARSGAGGGGRRGGGEKVTTRERWVGGSGGG